MKTINTQHFQIKSATKITFTSSVSPGIIFHIDETFTVIEFAHLYAILADDENAEVCVAFISKLTNPAEFINDGICRLLPKPKELMLKVEMAKLVGEPDE